MCTSIPRASAERRAARTGGAVTLGVWIRMHRSAFAKSVSMNVFSGVGGASIFSVGANGLSRGFRLWGLGRKIVGTLELARSLFDFKGRPVGAGSLVPFAALC
jgi:hypothetical protein